jgi:hypothetical protein
LYGSLGWTYLVAVFTAEVEVVLVLVSRPVVRKTLTGSGLVKLVDRALYDAGRTTCDESDDGESTKSHRFLLCVWCPSPLGAIVARGFAPLDSLKRIN